MDRRTSSIEGRRRVPQKGEVGDRSATAMIEARFGMSRADLVMYWVLRAADHFKDAQPIVAAAIENLEEERFEDRNANRPRIGARIEAGASPRPCSAGACTLLNLGTFNVDTGGPHRVG